LSILLFVATLCLLMRWTHEPEKRRFLFAASLGFGLALTNSQALAVAAPAFPIFVACFDIKLGRDMIAVCGALFGGAVLGNVFDWLPLPYSYSWLFDPFSAVSVVIGTCALIALLVLIVKTKGLLTKAPTVLACLALFVGGLSPYLYVPVASMSNPPLNWGYARTVEGFFHTINRGQYGCIHPADSLSHYFEQLWMYLMVTGKEFGWIYFPFAVLPFVLFRTIGGCQRRWCLSLMAIFVCLCPLMVALLNPGLDNQSREINKVFFSASYVVLAIWTGLGMACFVRRHTRVAQPTK
jgi:hypothetical protein